MLLWFAETTLVAGVLAALAIVGGRLRRIPPSARHALWLVVLIKFLTPPLVCWPWAIDWCALEWPTAWNQACGAVVAATDIPPSIVPVCCALQNGFTAASCDAEDSVPAGSDDGPTALPTRATEAAVAIDEPPARLIRRDRSPSATS